MEIEGRITERAGWGSLIVVAEPKKMEANEKTVFSAVFAANSGCSLEAFSLIDTPSSKSAQNQYCPELCRVLVLPLEGVGSYWDARTQLAQDSSLLAAAQLMQIGSAWLPSASASWLVNGAVGS